MQSLCCLGESYHFDVRVQEEAVCYSWKSYDFWTDLGSRVRLSRSQLCGQEPVLSTVLSLDFFICNMESTLLNPVQYDSITWAKHLAKKYASSVCSSKFSLFHTLKHKDAIVVAYNAEIQVCSTQFQASPDQWKDGYAVMGYKRTPCPEVHEHLTPHHG